MRWKFLALLFLFWVLGLQIRVVAHGVDVGYELTQALKVTAIYDTGEPMANAQVVVFSPSDPSTPWLNGSTDKQGVFTFTPDSTQPGNWEVQVRQAGHGDVITIPVAGKTSAIATSTALTPLQTSLMIGSTVWGCVGTALFFSRRK